jgi:aminocarboxymuconate-semialdehyde decarboxylase
LFPLIDVHCHVVPHAFPKPPSETVRDHWPCMRCTSAVTATMMVGDKPFRELDSRSWDAGRRIEDMDREGVSVQVLSPMPELLAYGLDAEFSQVICMQTNAQIAEMIAVAPKRFRGLGTVPLQDPGLSVRLLPRLHDTFGLSGVEIGSNINGLMLGDARFDPFWEAAQDLGMAVFVHALHPVAVKSIDVTPAYTAYAGIPMDVAMTASSLIMGGALDRFPRLRIAFSHGGGALGSILGRLDTGWERTRGYGVESLRKPSEQARGFFYDSNVYDPLYLRHLVRDVAPGQVFLGTDYPFSIMQNDPAGYLHRGGFDLSEVASLRSGAAEKFLGERITT